MIIGKIVIDIKINHVIKTQLKKRSVLWVNNRKGIDCRELIIV